MKIILKKTDLLTIKRVSLQSEEQFLKEESSGIFCRLCSNQVTTLEDMIARLGSHTHVFTNPAGIVYKIRLFKKAPGCINISEPTFEYTWFKGYAWSISICSQCNNHLGWYWVGTDDSFFGLIADRIIEGSTTH